MKFRISKEKRFAGAFLLLLCFAVYVPAHAQIRLPRLVRDSMVLQRDVKISIWGWATENERVSVQFDGKTYRSAAGHDGKWMLQLPAMKAGGPYTMEISGKNTIVLHDILIGDVWLCSGQSNMVHQMRLHSVRYPDEIANAHYPAIRQFWIPTLADLRGPQDDLPAGDWKSANPEDVSDFSAVAYFFAKELYEKYHIPIGIIDASVGGTPIEAWTSEEGLKDFPSIATTIEKNKDTAFINGFSRRGGMSNWPRPEDKGLTSAMPWYSPAYIPKGWRPMGVPGYWEDQGLRNLDGVVWYRKEIDVPASMTGRPAKVFLGRIVNADALYINGKEVGNTTYEYPQRRYTVPEGLLKPGKNLFVVSVTNNAGKGGFVPDKPYCLIAGNDTVDLKGYWEYKVGAVFIPRQVPGGGVGFSAQNAPAALYNAMIAPLIHYAIKGFVWYQGEANSNRAGEYAKLQPAMIADWRSKWKEGEIPFLYVQLPGFGDYNYLPTESGWAQLREAQLQSLSVPHTGMAVAIDLGEWNDLHPDRKKPVGDRLALAARKIAYGDEIVYSGPIFQSGAFSGGKVTISFVHTGSGLITNDGEEPQEFAIAGADKKFVWADAKIEGDKVVVWSDAVKDPKYVRYAWADDPVNPDLYNKEGLPASPFECAQTSSIPRLVHAGNCIQLLVDDKPYLIFGGELGNSSASSNDYMTPAWPKLKRMNLNTVIAPVYWESMEPAEGRFDFSLVDSLIINARLNDMRLVLLWFGSWKNSMSSYVPAWVKTDTKRFPRCLNKDGEPQEILSPFSKNNLEADKKAFVRLVQHIRQVDDGQNTVITIQVENEIGMLGSARSYDPAANAAFSQPVPEQLLSYLQKNKDHLAPQSDSLWRSNGFKTSGNWEGIFGKGPATDEIFMAWSFAGYVDEITAAGKAIYPLPMYVNTALNRAGWLPGQYPSGGPEPHLRDIWKAGAPAIDLLVPDIYFPEFQHWCDLYTRCSDALFIPEIRFEKGDDAKAFFSFGHYNCLSFSPFAIESAEHPENEPIGKAYSILRQISPLIVKYQPGGKVSGFLLSKDSLSQTIVVGDYRLIVKHDYTLPWSPGSREGAWPLTGCVIVAVSPDEFYVAGTGVVVTFASRVTGKRGGLLSVDEGLFENGKWISGRRMNGDQTNQGRDVRIPMNEYGIQRVKLYQY